MRKRERKKKKNEIKCVGNKKKKQALYLSWELHSSLFSIELVREPAYYGLLFWLTL